MSMEDVIYEATTTFLPDDVLKSITKALKNAGYIHKDELTEAVAHQELEEFTKFRKGCIPKDSIKEVLEKYKDENTKYNWQFKELLQDVKNLVTKRVGK